MDAPYYTVTVASLTTGWSYTATHGTGPDPDDPVHLGQPLTYRWGFDGKLLPGQLVPAVLSAVLYARTAADVPNVQVGDWITVDVRVGATGPRIVQPPPLRVTAAEVTVDLDTSYATELVVTAVDTLVDLPGMAPAVLGDNFGPPGSGLPYDDIRGARRGWRPRLAEIANRIGRSIGAPAWWADAEHPPPGTGSSGTYDGLEKAYVRDGGWNGRSARELLTEMMNSHQPSGVSHTVMAGYYATAASWPAGWGRVGPAAAWSDSGEPAVTEPQTNHRYYLMPASRSVTAGATPLPAYLAVSAGLLTVVPRASTGDTNKRIALDARWCEIPVTARRSREHLVNAVRMSGEIAIAQPSAYYKFERGEVEFTDAASQAAVGASARELSTALIVGPRGAYTPTAPATAAARFLSDASVLAVPWAYERLQLTCSTMPQAQATAILPYVAPRVPGEADGDGLVVRHVTVLAMDADARMGGAPMTGFVVAGTLTVTDGDMVIDLECVPGAPQYVGGAPTQVTVGQVDAATYQAHPAGDIDPRIRVSDLAYTAAA